MRGLLIAGLVVFAAACIVVVPRPRNPMIPKDCVSWYDGCNTCTVENQQIGACTKKACTNKEAPRCLERDTSTPAVVDNIPANCISWFDGCNTCTVENGQLGACTEMYCERKRSPMCAEYDLERTELTFKIDAQKRACTGVAPQQCLVVNGELFYDQIEGFDFKEGFVAEISVERTLAFPNGIVPADASKYRYKLLKVISMTKAAQILTPIPKNCVTWFDGCNNCSAKDGKLIGCTRKYCEEKAPARCVKYQ